MDPELVTSSASGVEGGAESSRPPLFRYTPIFEKYCSYYLAMGMTFDEYWNGDNELPKYFREKFKIEQELRGQNFWVQGAYFYDSMVRVAPLYNFMAKQRQEPHPYIDHPYPMTKEQQAIYAATAEQQKRDAALAKVRAWAIEFNRSFDANKSRAEKGGA